MICRGNGNFNFKIIWDWCGEVDFKIFKKLEILRCGNFNFWLENYYFSGNCWFF